MGKNLIKYGAYTPEAADRESKQLGKTDFLKLEVGKNRVRILPAKEGHDSPFVIVQQHRYEELGASYAKRYGCPGKGCPMCLKASQLSKTGNPKDRDAAFHLSAQPRVFALVINRKAMERGPIVWEFGKKIHEQLKKLRQSEDAGGDFTDPYEGFDVVVDREGTGKQDTRYLVMAARQSSPLHEDEEQMAEWMAAAPDLREFVKTSSPDELTALMEGEPEEPQRRIGSGQAAAQRRPTPAHKMRTAEDDVMDGEVVEE